MDAQFESALIRNIRQKTRVLIIFFLAIFIMEVSFLLLTYAGLQIVEFNAPISELLLAELGLLLVAVVEIFIYRHLGQVMQGRQPYRQIYSYLVSTVEISWISLVFIFESPTWLNAIEGFTLEVLLDSPLMLMYLLFITLSTFYLDFKLAVYTGIVAGLEYSVVAAYLIGPEGGIDLAMSIFNGLFFILLAVLSGLLSKKIRSAVLESLKAKNELIHELDAKVQERTAELFQQKELVEEKNRELTDSISYARRIQHAILPPAGLIKEYLPNSFILYKPKDIVAGDFYWLEKVGNTILFAAADCTGHGVPGAMVSVICNNGLKRSVLEYGIQEPGKILDKTRELVIHEFEKSEEEVKDGMDIALCSLEGNKLCFSGANNPLWIIRDGEIIEYKADKQPIGKFEQARPHTTHTVDLQAGDSLYIFSDGYVDQFGGNKGKKFMSKNFKNLLLSIQDKSMEEQKELIDKAFEDWRSSEPQVDDVCVIGVRV